MLDKNCGRAAGALAMLLAAAAQAQPAPARTVRTAPPTQAQIEALRQRLEEQGQQLDILRKALGEQDARYQALQSAIQKQDEARQQEEQRATRQAAERQREAHEPRTVQVGIAPPASESAVVVPRLFDQPGVLTPRGQTIFEPSVSYGYSSSNRAALVGYTVVPALLIGLVDVREVRRNTLTGAMALRYGITNRFEIEGKVPYVGRSDSAVSREIFTGTATDTAFGSSGRGIGDVEATGRYQLNDGSSGWPFLIGSLRVKSRTGRDSFQVVTDCVTRCVGNTTGTGQPLELPTGSGFYTVQPGLTWLYPSDPAVFFGSFSYAYNVARHGVSRQVLGGEREFIGTVKPGNVIGMNAGMGLALNDRSSFSIGVDLSSIGRTLQNGVAVPGSVRTQLATLMLGYSYRLNDKRTINFAVGAGLTRDTPDLTLTVRVPFTL